MKKKTVRKNRLYEWVFHILNNTFLVLTTIICLYPFYYILINTISSNVLSDRGDILFFPQQIHFTNYSRVLQIPGLSQAALVSVSRTVIGTILIVMCSSYLGFMFTQKKMWHRQVWYRFIILTMYFSAGLIPGYITMMNLGLLNNFLIYIIPGIVAPFNIILSKTFVESVPSAIQESAEIDGAGTMTIFIRVILPVIKPILATIAIFGAVGQWNNLMDTVIYITDQKLFTLQYVLAQYLNQASSLATLIQQGGFTDSALDAMTKQTATSVRMTVSIIVTLPILFVYPFFQRYFVQGIMIGSVKG